MNKKYYATRFTHDPKRKVVWKAIASHLQQFVPKDGVVLDLGCGYGDFINNIKAGKKHALDIHGEVKKYLDEDVEFHVMDGTKVGEIPENFDVVFASNFFEHFDKNQLNLMVEGIKTILKEGGKIVLMQPNYHYAYKEYFHDYTHKTIFSHVSLADFLVGHGFTIETVLKKYLPLEMKSRLPKSSLLTRLYLFSPFKPLAKQMLIVAQK
jgi:SAM-dependent methyltransferase